MRVAKSEAARAHLSRLDADTEKRGCQNCTHSMGASPLHPVCHPSPCPVAIAPPPMLAYANEPILALAPLGRGFSLMPPHRGIELFGFAFGRVQVQYPRCTMLDNADSAANRGHRTCEKRQDQMPYRFDGYGGPPGPRLCSFEEDRRDHDHARRNSDDAPDAACRRKPPERSSGAWPCCFRSSLHVCVPARCRPTRAKRVVCSR